MNRSTPAFRLFVWLLLSVPGAVIAQGYITDRASYGQVIHQSGIWSVGLLVAVLSITPIRRLFGVQRWTQVLLQQRRALGVASFGYAALHTGVYLERKWGADLILKEALEATLATGWLALIIFALLAVTSNDASVRRLQRRWKPLHRLVYPGAALTLAHWWLASFDPTTAYIVGGCLLTVQALRLSKT